MMDRACVLFALVLSLGACGGEATEEAPASTVEPIEVEAIESPIPEAIATEAATATEEVIATEVPADEPTAEPATAAPVQPTTLPSYMSLDPLEDRDCDEFPSQAAAQSYWEYHRSAERPNPGRLDGNGNSVVCEDPDRSARQAPAQEQAAPPPAAQSIACSGSKTCKEFGSQAQAQAYWEACGRPGDMDRNNNGVVCESLP